MKLSRRPARLLKRSEFLVPSLVLRRLQLEEIEWGGDTRGNGKADGRKLLRGLIVDGCPERVQTEDHR